MVFSFDWILPKLMTC